MRLKKEYLLLGIVILALGLYLFFNQRDRVHYTLPETPRIETADITRIEIERPGGKLTLKRADGQWRLRPGDYPADSAQVARMLSAIADLTVTALVSETQSFARYDLDADRRIDVRAYNEDKLVRQFTVGKAASTFRHTHVLVGEDKNVYHAAGSFRWEFDKPVDDLRDKTVLTVDRTTVSAISLTTEGQQIVVTKAPETAKPADAQSDAPASPPPAEGTTDAAGKPRWQTAAGEAVDPAAVDQLLSALDPLKCSAFLDDDSTPVEAAPYYRLELTGAETQTLEIFSPAADTASDYPARSSESPYRFKLSEFDVAKVKDFLAALTKADEEAESESPATPQ
ncbi:MAG: DUF4340 domain-containing protein [Desulfobacterales bacterium]|nr:DUF4340 domain-containing protein [Desulfobacterales bacterium]